MEYVDPDVKSMIRCAVSVWIPSILSISCLLLEKVLSRRLFILIIVI